MRFAALGLLMAAACTTPAQGQEVIEHTEANYEWRMTQLSDCMHEKAFNTGDPVNFNMNGVNYCTKKWGERKEAKPKVSPEFEQYLRDQRRIDSEVSREIDSINRDIRFYNWLYRGRYPH